MERSSYSQVFSHYIGETGELIPILQELQDGLGYLSEECIEKTAEFPGITENEIFGVASFYGQFRFEKPGRNIIRVCTGTACHVGGGQWISETIEREPESHGAFQVEEAPGGGEKGTQASQG